MVLASTPVATRFAPVNSVQMRAVLAAAYSRVSTTAALTVSHHFASVLTTISTNLLAEIPRKRPVQS